MRKRVVLIVLLVLVLVGAWAYRRFVVRRAAPPQQQEQVTVQRGDLTTLVNAAGTVLPREQTLLAFKGAGRVAEVDVEEGQAVQAGEVLARLEASDMEFGVRQAELSLAIAQTQLARLQQPPSQADIAAAQAAVDSAQASYDALAAGRTPEEIQVARAGLDSAKAAMDQAQAAYNVVASRPDAGMLPQSLQLQQATIAYNSAKASFDLATRKPSAPERAAARSGVKQAEASLARLQAGVPEDDLLTARLQVEQAQLALDRARSQLDTAILVAPHDGTVTGIRIQVGELTAGQTVMVLTDLSEFHVDVSVDEVDIGRLAVGQSATLTLDALPDETLVGRVARVADTSQIDSGVVTYNATIALDPTQALLRAGMTANADIVTDRHAGVLLVPNRFVRADRTTGQTFVDRLSGQQIQSVEVQLGLRDETSSEVLAGLSEGDVLVLVQQSSRQQLQGAFQMGGQ